MSVRPAMAIFGSSLVSAYWNGAATYYRGIVRALHDRARGADILVKTSGVGVFDELLESAVPAQKGPGTVTIYWDVDAPATLDRLEANPADPLRALIPQYDMVLTYGGGEPVVRAYTAIGA